MNNSVFQIPAFGQPLTHPADWMECPSYWDNHPTENDEAMLILEEEIAELDRMLADFDGFIFKLTGETK